MPAEGKTDDHQPAWHRVAGYAGCVLLLVWAVWWILSFASLRLVAGHLAWFPANDILGHDFLHNYLGSRMWFEGANPYEENFGDSRGLYAYPPIVLGLFTWVNLFPPKPAIVVWSCVVAASTVVGMYFAQQWRKDRGESRFPFPAVMAIALISTPVVFAMERGNCDALVVLFILGAIVSLQKRSLIGDAAAGLCTALAVLTKIYPCVLIVSLIGLRRYRAAALSVAGLVLITAMTWQSTRQWLAVSNDPSQGQGARISVVADVKEWLSTGRAHRPDTSTYRSLAVNSHSLSFYWYDLWEGLVPNTLSRVPGLVGSGAVLFAVWGWVAFRLFVSNERERFAFPFLMWSAGLATFWMPISYDYNLLCFVIAVIALWRSDLWYCYVLTLPALLWWQPFRFPIPASILFLFKLMLLCGGGLLIVSRLSRPNASIKLKT